MEVVEMFMSVQMAMNMMLIYRVSQVLKVKTTKCKVIKTYLQYWQGWVMMR